MQRHSISGWRIHMDNGRRYMDTARRGLARPEVFTNDLILQLAAMAMESLLVSVWQYYGYLPYDHTLSGLVEGLADFCPLSEAFVNCAKQVEGFDDICTLLPGFRRSPSDADIAGILNCGEQLVQFVHSRLN